MTQYNFWKAVLFVSLGIFPAQSLAGIRSFEVQSAANSGNTHPAGETIEIRCSVDGMTEPQVQIYKTTNSDLGSKGPLVTCQFGCSTESLEHYKFSILTSNGLTVLTILINGLKRDKDEMYWTCQASKDRISDKKILQLIIATEPKDVVVQLIPVCDLANTKCVVTCQTSSCTYPSPTFHWLYTTDSGGTKNNMFKDFSPVPTKINDVSCNHPETIHASTITVPKYTTLPDNSAQTIKLLCRIDFITLKTQLESNLSEQLQMAVQVESVSIEPVPGAVLDVIEQQSTNISCRSSGSRPQSTVSWFKQNGQTSIPFHDGISYETTTNGDSLIVTISTLTFRVTRQDQGWILTCTVSNFEATGISANNPKTLNVLYSPSITGFEAGLVGGHPSSESVTVNEYDDITGHCEADSNPAPSIEVSQRVLSIAKADNSKEVNFLIPNVTCQNNGQIICKSRNDVPRSSIAEKALQLNVRCSPRIEQSVDPFVVAKEKTTATLSLSILAYPLPSSYRWYRRVNGVWEMVKNDTNFLITSHQLQYNLTVTDIQRQHYGEYNLSVSNGEEPPLTFTFYLQNKGKPEVPTDVSITVTSSTAVTVTWSPGYDGEVSQEFYLQYKTQNEQDWMTETVADPGTNERLSFSLNDLQPSTEYVLIIFASNTQGNSSISEMLPFRTKDPKSSSVAGIIGGTVGGVIAVFLIIVCICCILRRKRLPEGMKTKIFGQRSNKKQAEAKYHEESPQATGYIYSVVNKEAGEQSLTDAQESNSNDGSKQGDQCYENPDNLQPDETSNVKPPKKTKPAKHKQKQQAPKNLSHDGLEYADLSFDNTGKSGKHKRPPKPKREEGVVYDAVQIGVVGEAYCSNKEETNAAK